MFNVCADYDSGRGAGIKNIHMDNFTITVATRDLIEDWSMTLCFGRHYEFVGRNNIGKTS